VVLAGGLFLQMGVQMDVNNPAAENEGKRDQAAEKMGAKKRGYNVERAPKQMQVVRS
jgi:hypothetical protein